MGEDKRQKENGQETREQTSGNRGTTAGREKKIGDEDRGQSPRKKRTKRECVQGIDEKRTRKPKKENKPSHSTDGRQPVDGG